jgi:serine/threonine protein kinase
MEMTRFLRFAVGTAAALSGLHEKELIHKDVKPANVLVNPATGQARLMGFGIASRLPRERQAPEPEPTWLFNLLRLSVVRTTPLREGLSYASIGVVPRTGYIAFSCCSVNGKRRDVVMTVATGCHNIQ